MILPMNLNKTTKNHSHETSLFNCRLNNSIKLYSLTITFDILPFFISLHLQHVLLTYLPFYQLYKNRNCKFNSKKFSPSQTERQSSKKHQHVLSGINKIENFSMKFNSLQHEHLRILSEQGDYRLFASYLPLKKTNRDIESGQPTSSTPQAN